MIDQFEAEKCLNAASTDNLVFMITDKRTDPGQPPDNSDGTHPGLGLKIGAKPRGFPGGC